MPDFWLSPVMARKEAARIRDALSMAWVHQEGTPPGDLSRDLDRLRLGLFNPIARGKTLREAIARLPMAPTDLPLDNNSELFLSVGGGRVAVTPEGRVAIELISHELAQTGDDAVVLTPDAQGGAQALLRRYYREAATKRLLDVVKLQEGVAPKLAPAGIGAVLFLLVNGSTTPDRALLRPRRMAPGSAQAVSFQTVDAVWQRSIEAFAETLEPHAGKRKAEHYSLDRGYALTEAKRRLAGAVQIGAATYIDPGAEAEAFGMVIRELRSRGATAASAGAAFDALLQTYRELLPKLASQGVAHERPIRTRELRARLVELVGREATNS